MSLMILSSLFFTAFLAATSGSDANPFSAEQFYVDPDSDAQRQAESWRTSRPQDAAMVQKIANQPTAYYFSEWTEDTASGTSAQVDNRVSRIVDADALPVLGAYALPQRDCGGYSGGGLDTAEEYKRWIRDFARGIGNREAVVVLEPDALADSSCLSRDQRQERFELIEYAVGALKSNPGTYVYIDAGNPEWRSAGTMASRLRSAGIDQADGFALNISNFISTEKNISYGKDISAQVGGKHFIIDTSRNGLGASTGHEWCNPPGRALGERPTDETGEPLVDAFFWMKQPGESDGECGNHPPAGAWMPEFALGLAERASY